MQKDNPAVRFYQRLGFEICDDRIDHAGHEDYLMTKELWHSSALEKSYVFVSSSNSFSLLLPGFGG